MKKGQTLDILVRNSSELKGAFSNASDGDVIKLAPGDYGSVRLRDQDFTNLTITSAESGNRAKFDEYLEFRNVSGVTVEGVDFDAGSLAPAASFSRVQIVSSENMTLRDMSVKGYIPTASEGKDPASASRLDAITGFGYENGVRVRFSDDVTVKDVEFSDVRQALSVNDSNGTKISDVNVHHVREGININDVTDTVIENSWFHDFKPFTRKDHPDMIQYWGTNSGVDGLVVKDNLLDQSDGWTQSIFGHFNGRPDNVTGSDFLITGNTIINAHPNAIRIREIDGFEISDNLLLPNDVNYDYRRLPNITVLNSENGNISENLLLPRYNGSLINLSESQLAAANIDLNNNIALSTDPSSEFYWQKLLDGVRPNIPRAEEKEEEVPVVDASNPEAPVGEGDPVTESDALPDEDLSGEGDPETEGGVEVSNSIVEEPSDVGEPLEEAPVTEDLSGEDAPVVVEAPDDNTGDEVQMDEPDDVPALAPSQIDISGTSGRDMLRDVGGSTSLAGMEGSDRFLFDYRRDTASAQDVIFDFDFSEGDRLILVGNERGTFDNSIDPGNNLMVHYGGARTHIRSSEDLLEAAANGGVSLEASDDGNNLIITLGEAPERSIELVGISPDGFLM